MIKIHTTLAAACAALTLAAAPSVRAQEAPPGEATEAALDAIEPLMAELVEKLRPLAESLGVTLPELMRDLGPMMRSAFPAPAADLEGWAFGMNFRDSNAVNGDGSATEGRQPILADAQACAARYPDGGPVVHFRRIRREGMPGHQCVLRTYDGTMGMIISETYAEGADRHVNATYNAAASTNDAEVTRALLEPAVDANIALAVRLADLALEATIRKVPGAD